MSRVGKNPITIPDGVTVTVADSVVTVTGPKGTLTQTIEHPVAVEVTEKEIFVSPSSNMKKISQYWGLYRALINNLVQGVTQGFEKKLQVQGVGYRVMLQGTKLVLNLGYSHPIEIEAPQGITFAVDKNEITVSGIDKALVGQTAANIRDTRPPEPYKGKGVRYADEFVRTKVGKKAGA